MTPEKFLQEYETSTRAHGLEHTFSLIDKNAVYWFSDGTCHVGKKAIEEVIQYNFENIQDETYQICDVEWIDKSADIAVCIFRFEWSGIVRGKTASGFGRGTLVLSRRSDSWVVMHEHLSKGEHKSRKIN